MKKVVIFLILFGLMVSPVFAKFKGVVGVSEEMQVRFLQIESLPMIFANVVGIGIRLNDTEHRDMKYMFSASTVLTGMMITEEANGSSKNYLAYGGGGALSSRFAFDFFSLKSEVSGLIVSTGEKTVTLFELGVDFGLWFDIRKNLSITADLVRLGIRPPGTTQSWIPNYDGPFYVSTYPTVGIVLYF